MARLLRSSGPATRPVHFAPLLILAMVVLVSCADRGAAGGRPPEGGGTAHGSPDPGPATEGGVVYFEHGGVRQAIVAGADTVLEEGDVLVPPDGGGGWRITATRKGAAILIRKESDFGGQHRIDDHLVALSELPLTVPNATWSILVVGRFLVVP